MSKHRQRVKGSDEADDDDILIVLNAIKRSVDFSTLVKTMNKDNKQQVHDVLKKVARKACRLLRDAKGTSTSIDTLHALAQLQIPAQRTGLPPQLGTKRAREIFEIVVGASILEPCIDYVTHHENPAPYRARGHSVAVSSQNCDSGGAASAFTAVQDNDSVSELEAEAETSDASLQDSSLPEPVYLLEFARSPKEFYRALQSGPELEPVRTALEAEQLSPLTGGGAWIFVHPRQYEAALSVSASWKLKPRHVIVAAEYESNLMETLKDIGRGVVEKDRKILPPPPMIIKRTFLEVPVQSSLRSEPPTAAVASTTDTNARAKHRPRKA